ncbi:PREDICTED: flowering time control protein FY-like [Amphimedon queenslandica]|uniref:Uncharacterized protein n=1 Tax=Amphimedon queenslandica TaxID=400682 RepID=A0A1X7TWQ5_AMPQE|nr:PREDICTED: flowering time control protein FY-like [Amphimedon queenslandica]|eukprot:XP_019857308.1 PREDICTED: flowering time control protein FY-like [Amphimedon queenslandica]
MSMMMMMNEGPPMLSPTFPNQLPPGGPQSGPNKGSRPVIRKTVEYHATALHYLKNRLWQRDRRDKPLIQPDLTYYNDVSIPAGLEDCPVNVVTTKFVKACTNKTRSPIFSTSWVPDGRRLVTGAASGEFTLWNGINFNFESIIQAHDCSVRTIDWSHDGKWMVTADDRGFIKYWQINFNNVHTYQAHSEPIRSTSFSPTDAKLATCSDDGTIRVFDFLSCTEEHILRGHGADVKCLDWHPRKSLLASGSKDNQQPVKLWDARTGQSVCTIHAHKATVMDIKWNRNGNWLATASRDYLIKLYDVRMMKELYVLKGHKKDVNTISWHPVHEKVFASGGSDGAILFWLVGNEREIGGMESAHEGFVWSLAWHPLGHLLCSGANDHTCKFWCRNRPGEELKDKYNSYHNPFYMGDDIEISGGLPGMNIMEPQRGGIGAPLHLMPPPPSRDAVTLPPPSAMSPWRQGGGESGLHALPGPRVDIPVLGADIIAQTFDEKNKEDVLDGNKTFENQELPSPVPPGGPRPLLGPPRGFHDDQNESWERPGPFGGPHPPHPPEEMGGGRYNWHRFDYHPRRPSFDEDRWNPNPFVYRREPNGPPRGPPPGQPGQRRDSQDFPGYRPPPPDEFNNRPRDYIPPPPSAQSDRQFDRMPPHHNDRKFERPSPIDDRYERHPPPGDRYDLPPSNDRSYDRQPQFDRPPGDRQFERPPEDNRKFERQFERPPPSGERQFDRQSQQFERPPFDHPPPDDRQFDRPPGGERRFERSQGDRNFDRQFERPPPPQQGDRGQFPPENYPRGPPHGNAPTPLIPPTEISGGGPENRFPHQEREHPFPPPQDPRQAPPSSIQDERKPFQPSDPRQRGSTSRDDRFGYGHAPLNYKPPDLFQDDRPHPQFDSGSGRREYQQDGPQFNGPGSNRDSNFVQDPRQPPPPGNFPSHKPHPADPRQRGGPQEPHPSFGHAPSNYHSGRDQYKPPGQDRQFDGRDPRFDRGGSNYRDHDDRRRDPPVGGRGIKNRDDPRKHGRGPVNEKDPLMKKPKRDQTGEATNENSRNNASSMSRKKHSN